MNTILEESTQLNKRVNDTQACLRTLARTNAPKSEIDRVTSLLQSATAERDAFEEMVTRNQKREQAKGNMSEKRVSERVGHTPGPWEVTPAGGISGDGEAIVINSVDSCLRYGSKPMNEGFGRAEANARLIASAPALLAELQRVEARLTACARAFYVDGTPKALRKAFEGWKSDIDPARKAIRDATGGEQ